MAVSLAILIMLSACEKGREPFTFYPIDSLVTAQVVKLTDLRATLHKEASVGKSRDTITYAPADTTAWLQELEIFRQLSVMNKPVNKGSYLVDDNLYDPGSNLTVKAFTSLEELPVRSLRVFYETSVKRPRRIEAVYTEANSLYQSSRVLTMEFQHISNTTLLTSYSVSGGQKMVMADSVAYSVSGKIHVN